MKCLKCGSVNKKTNELCKVCKEPLHIENIKEENKKLNEKEENIKVDIKPETKEQEKIPSKKKFNFFKKIWTAIKVAILLLILGVVGLSIYVYGFYNYNKYFEENMNRYYNTESDKYLENIKLVFSIYGYDDKKVETLQDKASEMVSQWLKDIENEEYKSSEEYIGNLTYLENIITTLYEDTDVKGNTTINKKTYISLTYKINELIKDVEKSEDEEDLNNNEKYDVSMMNEVDLQDILDMFEDNNTYILYIGRNDCSACISYVPVLQQAQEEYGYTTQYFDLNKLEKENKLYEKVIEKLSYEYEMIYNGEEKKATFGEWMGFTPMTIIIKDGKQVGGLIGAIDYQKLSEYLEEFDLEQD